MSNMHILDASGNRYRVALHVSIPVANNNAGIAYATALINSGKGGKTVLPTGTGAGQITTAELASVTAGSIYEQVDSIDVTNGGQYTTAPQQATYLNDYFASRSVEVRNLLQSQLLWFGQNL